MHRVLRYLLAVATVVASVPVALAAAEPATGDKAAPADPGPEPAPITSAGARAAIALAGDAVDEIRTPRPSLIAAVEPGETVTLLDRPRGRPAVTVGDTTEFGTARRLGVVRRSGRWLGVTTPSLPNGTLGWVDRRSPSLTLSRTSWSIHADVSARRIVLRRAGLPVRRLSVAVGRPDAPTPTGRFAVTDEIAGDRFGPYYGCCILAISATQPNTPPGWTGGNRMAIHGTDAPSSIGSAASAGCLRAGDSDLRFLMRHVPIGTPVVIRP